MFFWVVEREVATRIHCHLGKGSYNTIPLTTEPLIHLHSGPEIDDNRYYKATLGIKVW